MRMNVSIYHNAMICGDWKLEAAATGVTSFHIVTVGECKLYIPDMLDSNLNIGDLVIFPREIPHTIRPTSPMRGAQRHIPYDSQIEPEGTGLLCGSLRFNPPASIQLLDALPSVMVIPREKNRAWLNPIIELIINESVNGGLASDVILDRLCEVLFIQSLKFYLQQDTNKIGILRLYSHPRITNVLSSIHRDPSINWTVEQMARCAAQSRTQFAKTFRELSGITPMQYLTWLRMQLAWQHLSAGLATILVAEKAGYQSETAFLRAFKKEFAVTAGEVKRGRDISQL